MNELVIKTSEVGWLTKLSVAYKKREDVTLIDDAKIGINPKDETLFKMGIKAKLSKAEIVAVGTALGMGSIGISLLAIAFFDPEPFSKLGLLVGSGVVLLFSGGFSAIMILAKQLPPNVEFVTSTDGRINIRVSWTKADTQ